MSTPPPPGTQAVQRAIHLLRTFSDHPEQTLRDLCARTSLTKTTAHRLLSVLESEGLVARDSPKGAYHLGPQLVALGSQARMSNDLQARVRPSLQRLAQETGESATLEVFLGADVLILDGVKGRHVISAGLEIGTRWPAHATSTGKSMLAQLEPGSLEVFLARPLASPTEATLAESRALRSELEQVRRQGYAVANEELELDFVAVAAAILDASGSPCGALSLGGPARRFSPERIGALGETLRAEARLLTDSLTHG